MGHGSSSCKEAKSACSGISNKTCNDLLVLLITPLSQGHLLIRDYKRPLQTSKDAFNRLVASYIGPYTLHEAIYWAEITAMVFVAGLPIDISSDCPVSIC